MRNRSSVSSKIRGGPGPGATGSQPAPGRRRHLGVVRPLRIQVQPGPVGGDRLDRHRVRGAGGQGGAHRVGEAARADPGRGHVLGHALQPDDLARGRPGQLAELSRGSHRLRGVAGVHAQRGQPGRHHEAPAHLGRAELGPARGVVGQLGVRRQAEDGRAQPPEREPGLGVEHRAARPARALGQQRLQRGLVRVAVQDAVTMVVNQRLFRHAAEQFRHGASAPVPGSRPSSVSPAHPPRKESKGTKYRSVAGRCHDARPWPSVREVGVNLFVRSRVTHCRSYSSGGDLQ